MDAPVSVKKTLGQYTREEFLAMENFKPKGYFRDVIIVPTDEMHDSGYRCILEQRQKYLKNAYRVLLTRSRQGLVIYVPKGADPSDDPTRDRELYDSTFDYLRSCGIEEMT